MATAMTMFDNPKMAVPAHVAAFFESDGNIADKQTVPSLTYGGKVWTIHKDGEKIKMTRKNEDGDTEMVQSIKVVILDYAKSRGRAYYEGAYDPDKPGRPVCWSDDGNKPDASIEAPQAHDCKTCPMSAKGSKISESGKAVTACAAHRMIVVVPASKPDSTPLRCKLAITSLFDKQSPDLEAAGWLAFEQYVDLLRSRGVMHTASVVTKMKFDPNTDYPKVIFSPDRWLEPTELGIVGPLSKDVSVTSLLDGTYYVNGSDATKKVDDFEQGDDVPEPAAPAAKPAPKAAAKPVAKPAPKAVAPKPEPEPEPEEAVPAAAVGGDVPDDVAALLSEWG